MPRRLAPLLATIAGFSAAFWWAMLVPAFGQGLIPPDLFSPEPDGAVLDADRRFTPGTLAPAPDRSRFGEFPPFGRPPPFGTQPASGAGVTGFDSTNTFRRRAGEEAEAAELRLRRTRQGADLSVPQQPTPRPADTLAPELPPRGENVPPTEMLLPRRLVRRGAPEAATMSRLNVPTTIQTVRRSRPPAEDDPFAPVGIRLGTFRLRPAIEFIGGLDSNPPRVEGLAGSSLFTVQPELQVRSDWARHALNADLRGSYTWYKQSYNDPLGGSLGTPASIDRPELDSRVNGRIDVSSLSRADIEGRFLISTDNPGSPNVQAGLRRFPWVTTIGGTLAFTQEFNRFEITAEAALDDVKYQHSVLVDGTSTSNDDRDYHEYAGELRAGYELKPGLEPFVEAGFINSIRELPIDRFGFARTSHTRFAKIGSTIEITDLLIGEVAFGYLRRQFKDPRLPVMQGWTVDGSLIYEATALTTVTLTAATTADEITTPGVAGLFSRGVTARIDHDFRRWLTGTVELGIGHDDYVGSPRSDLNYAVSLSMLYRLSRQMQLRAEVRREWLQSNLPDLSWSADTALLGLRLQR